MNSQDFLTLNLVGAGAFLFWYLVSRGGSTRPTQLNMKAKDSAPTLLNAEAPAERPVDPVPEHPFSSRWPATARSLHQPRPAKHLNIMFNYNGHSWDAYEVLGVPAGASLRIVTEAYQAALKRVQPESLEFYETAYKAILHQQTGGGVSGKSGS